MEEDEEDYLTLKEFLRRFPLPETGRILHGVPDAVTSQSGRILELHSGDVILVRSITVDAARFSFYDDECYKKDARVAGNFPGKFVVLSPYDETEESPDTVTYSTVEDLVKDCPPYFQATVSYDDYNYRFSAGDRFRFLKLYHNSRGYSVVECRHMDGRRMHLQHDIIGQFQPLSDTHYYTIGELADLAPVPRRLKLADDSINKMCTLDVIPSEYSGDLFMHEPEYIVHISPWNNLTEIINLPVTSDIKLCLITVEDDHRNVIYDTVRYSLAQFARTYEDNFPVESRLESYPDIPTVMQPYLFPKSNICIHSYEKVEKLLAKSKDSSLYVLSKRLQAKYRLMPRTFTCVAQLLTCNIGTKLKVQEHVGCDVPKPFSMQPGDLVKITTQRPGIASMKRGWNKPSEQIPILKCEKLNRKGSFEPIKLPLDLDLLFLELMPGDIYSSYAFHQLFDNKPELPIDVEIIQFDGSDLPLICQLSLRAFVRDPCLIVSIEQSGKDNSSRTTDITPRNRVKYLEIPDRHRAALSFVDSLHTAQLTYPRHDEITDIPAEMVTRKVYTDLENDDMSYQTIDMRPNTPVIHKTKSRSRPLSAVSFSQITKSLSQLKGRSGRKTPAYRTDSLNVSPTSDPNVYGKANLATKYSDGVHRSSDEGLYEDVIIQPMRKAVSSDEITCCSHTKQGDNRSTSGPVVPPHRNVTDKSGRLRSTLKLW